MSTSTEPGIYDFAGIGVGPFNLGLAALSEPVDGLDGVFLEQRGSFDWHPGMMLEPACIGGRLISPSPTRGPDDSSRKSLQVFDSLTATRFRTPDSCTKLPQSWVASIRFEAVTTGMPVVARKCSQTRRA